MASATSVIKLMEGTSRELKFHQVITTNDSFELSSYEIDKDEVLRSRPRISTRLAFPPILGG